MYWFEKWSFFVFAPPSQVAHRKGQSTTEHDFATKILTVKNTNVTITIILLMLDMSKAFDTVVRAILPKEPIKHNWQQKKTVRSKLETRNPNVKETKTEEHQIKWSQVAHRKGQSTTEHDFATKILTVKNTNVTITIILLMLDMSKAFDTVVRAILPKEPIKHNWQQKKTVQN